jgi:hypothetical protein
VIADVGQGRAEEIDFSPASAGRGAGANYGWRCYEGRASTPGVADCEPPGHVLPVLEHLQSNTNFCAIVGGYVVRDPTLGSLTGRYVYGDNCEPALRSTVLATPDALDDKPTGHSVTGLTSFGEDACGRVYAVTFGAVHRFEGTPAAQCDLPDPYPGPGGGGAGNPPPGPEAGGGTDGSPPDLAVTRRQVQRILRQRGVVIGVGCDEPCTIAASGRLSVPGPARVFKLRPRTRTLAAGSRVRMKLRLTRRARPALRRALRRGRRVRARVSVRASDPLGNARSVTKTVRARR